MNNISYSIKQHNYNWNANSHSIKLLIDNDSNISKPLLNILYTLSSNDILII